MAEPALGRDDEVLDHGPGGRPEVPVAVDEVPRGAVAEPGHEHERHQRPGGDPATGEHQPGAAAVDQEREQADADRHQRTVLLAEQRRQAREEEQGAAALRGAEQGEEHEGDGERLGVEVEPRRPGEAHREQVGGAGGEGRAPSAHPLPRQRPERHDREPERERLPGEKPERGGVEPVQGDEEQQGGLEVLPEEAVVDEARPQPVSL